MTQTIRLRDVREHNLDGVDVEFPRGKMTVVTGVSGSGKSSLVFDTLHAASERRYLETLSAHARQFLQRMPSPKAGAMTGLSPSVALSQRRSGDHARSTVGTLSGLHDQLRFWYARENGLEPRQLSFVSAGACDACRGLGAVDEVSRELLVADAKRTLREGALVPTTPTGYIVYSQVTVEALDMVCKAHGFDVDTPWGELTREQQDVVFYGSERVEVPFGKHSLESRMKWEGITAKPRELGHYKGLIPTIEDILRRTRNENALRFARSVPCSRCEGTRLQPAARAAVVDGLRFDAALRLPFPDLARWCAESENDQAVRLRRRLEVYDRLGLRHLSCDRSTSSLSGGEHQRLRLGAIATDGLSGVTFVFDEPSIGLHATEEAAVLELLLELRDAGNTVVVVEHSEHALRAADHVIDVGPGAGSAGGRVLYSGPPSGLPDGAPTESATRALYAGADAPIRPPRGVDGAAWLRIDGACANNLRGIDVAFAVGRLNVVSGVAGAGKSTLVGDVLAQAAKGASLEGRAAAARGFEAVTKVVYVDQDPIGRTPRSNAATYTGVFDEIRKLFAAQPASGDRGFKASTFSFNTKGGGRCSECEGSGREVVGMHGLPPVELQCSLCGGKRFRDDVLEVCYRGASILDVLELSVDAAIALFEGEAKICRVLTALADVGLGYLPLGQPATTLSGGEAQRVKLAGELARGGAGGALFILEEPTIGLHRRDVVQLLRALDGLVARGHTVVTVEHDLDVIRAADHVIDLGPGAGPLGGRVAGAGGAAELVNLDSPTGAALRGGAAAAAGPPALARPLIQLRGASTHNLRAVDLDLPAEGLTVVTGVSGSGKSSLVFDTLFGESRARMTEHLSGFVQRQLGAGGVRARSLRSARGLRPVIALRQRAEAATTADRRATVATAADLHPPLRTMWSRAAASGLSAACFSFFRKEGACDECGGLGVVRRCDVGELIDDASAPLFRGALRAQNKVVRDFVDPTIRNRALIEAVARSLAIDLNEPWSSLADAHQRALLHGCGAEEFDAVWEHEGAEGGAHRWRARWSGIAGSIDQEYARRVATGAKSRRADYEALMGDVACEACQGDRLQPAARAVELGGVTLPALCRRSVAALGVWLREAGRWPARARAVTSDARGELARRCAQLCQLGLGHLALDRGVTTLSAGERQRVRLARQLAAPLTGCVYVLDEPTLGLHPSDVDALLASVRGLVDAGNAVVAVEHDVRVIAAASHVVEVGPGAGDAGGRVVAAGPPTALDVTSRTAGLLGRAPPALRSSPRAAASGAIVIRGAFANSLKDVDVAFPAGQLTVVTGVSGSGKTSLVRGVLAASAQAERPIGCRALTGMDLFDRVVDDASARAQRTRSACVATLLGVYDALRKRFADTAEAKKRGWRAAHFALRSKSGGACRDCGGTGWQRSEFDFLGAGQWAVCDACQGRRFDDETLSVRWLGRDLSQTLELSVAELSAAVPAHEGAELLRPLQLAARLGLGYLTLGQAGDALSGGEAQRLMLAQHLSSSGAARTLFLLDEPTRGLHVDDVSALQAAIHELVGRGDTVVAVEHDLDLVADADHVVDMGPSAGDAGGSVVFEGAPRALARCQSSVTGAALRGR